MKFIRHMKRGYLFSMLLLWVTMSTTSCKQADTNGEHSPVDLVDLPKTDATGPDQALRSGWHCFQYTMDRDTYSLVVNVDHHNVTGQMWFKNYEKDSSKGDITGTLEEDILHIFYSFESEGMSSVREMILKVRNNLVVTGVVEEIHRGDSALIANPEGVVFEGIIYSRIICEQDE